jgi:hypothetical protein
MFGKYFCGCGNNWASGNAWAGAWQKCRKCHAKVMPDDLQPLQPGNSRQYEDRRPHETDLCQRCLQLGYNCQNYVPPPWAEEDTDDQSVISDSSTISTVVDQDLGDGGLTPVASDDEEFLESAMQNLRV